MFRLVKWAYDIGRQHERRRIELAISEYRHRDELPYFVDEDRRKEQESFNRTVDSAIHDLLHPTTTEIVEKSILDE